MSTPPEHHPAEEFTAAFNQLDQAIRKQTGMFDRDRSSFMAVFSSLTQQHRWLERHVSQVRLIANLRNVIAHAPRSPGHYIATPEPIAIDYVRDLHRAITRPPTVDPRFTASGGVSVVGTKDSIEAVLELVRERDFTHVPVVAEECVQGVLTATGVLRWLGQAAATESLIDFADVKVDEVLAAEDPSVESFRLIGRLTPVPDALYTFAENPALQALVITHSGAQREKPIGIITTWDAMKGLGTDDSLGVRLDGALAP